MYFSLIYQMILGYKLSLLLLIYSDVNVDTACQCMPGKIYETFVCSQEGVNFHQYEKVKEP